MVGWLFLLQAAAGLVLAATVLLTRSWLAAAAGACLALATLGGYLLSVSAGLYGFREVRTTAGVVAGVVEVAAVAALAAFAAGRAARPGRAASVRLPGAAVDAPPAGRRAAHGLAAGLSALALAMLTAADVAARSATGLSGAAGGGHQALRAVRIGSVAVLADNAGRTVYWFAPDRPDRSVCYGPCAAYWPPVTGRPAAGPGVTGRIAVIRRSDGASQATYNGHPLYTYVGDSAPGQARGNGLDLNGGLWHDVVLPR